MTNLTLNNYSVAGQKVYYVPEFITPEEESYLVRKINETPQPKWKRLANRRLQIWGGELNARNALLSQPLPTFLEVYPPLIQRLRETRAFTKSPHGGPNHIILNEYLAGQGIMPHEDGPAYYPVVATISLGSHAMFHYYRYKEEARQDASGSGRVVDRIPVLSVLLEPRSLIISTDEMYTDHLHGIDEVTEDIISPGGVDQPARLAGNEVSIDNWNALTDDEMKIVMRDGGALTRKTRYSLTCRDVKRIIGGKGFMRRR